MRIVRFSPAAADPTLELGKDPLFGVLAEGSIAVINGDPLYMGANPTGKVIPLSQVRLLAPVLPRSKVVCIGKNYADHAKEMGGEVPQEPIIFLKPNTSVIGPGDTIAWPAMSDRVDFEAELAIVIGRICKDVPKERASDVIFGYTLANDVTARDLQKRDGQWTRAKGFDTFCPLGPWIETDFIPGNQQISSTLNGEIMQSAKLSEMIFDIPTIINFVTQVMTLLPGDVILTGTPAGIAPMPERSVITVAIEGLGELTNKVSVHG
ncbi:MAG: fumarylacetoacetate hydrolase family protein [Actinobacteria bacterium]|nr:fumarylacetoacetate hydrolase family protein [Actinomycetota bacterium]